MTVPVQGMTVGEIFERAVRLVGKTITRNLIISVVVLLPGAAMLGLSMYAVAHQVAVWIAEGPAMAPQDFMQDVFLRLLPALLLFAGGLLVLTVSALLAQGAMMVVVASEVEDRPITWGEAIRTVAGIRWARIIGMWMLQAAALGSILLVPYALFFIPVKGVIVIAIFLIVAAIPVVMYLSLRWMFCQVIVSYEGDTVLHSFVRSSYLVSDNWWRTFGILLLLSFAAQMAASFVVMPVAFIAMFSSFANMLPNMHSNAPPDMSPDKIYDMVTGMVIAYSVMIALSTVLQLLLQSVYLVVMYFDLRARKGEFNDAAAHRDGNPLIETPYPLV
ncbi:MAG: hypothetical protein IPP94_11825 [Ignavibacteria bacterium]|nr:hypothetical protein [Ignavibacteria bacterium]